jgi:hypothetical protein
MRFEFVAKMATYYGDVRKGSTRDPGKSHKGTYQELLWPRWLIRWGMPGSRDQPGRSLIDDRVTERRTISKSTFEPPRNWPGGSPRHGVHPKPPA